MPSATLRGFIFASATGQGPNPRAIAEGVIVPGPPERTEVEGDGVEGLGRHQFVGAVARGWDPGRPLAPVHLEGLHGGIHDLEMLHGTAGVEGHLLAAVELFAVVGESTSHPQSGTKVMGLSSGSR